MSELEARAVRGGVARACSQIASLLLQLTGMVVLARLVDPKDFGLVAMVAVPIGILSLFRECGLSTASVQQVSITSEQVSTLFWINVGVGVALAVVTVAGNVSVPLAVLTGLVR